MLKLPNVLWDAGDGGGAGQPDQNLSQQPAQGIDGQVAQLYAQLESSFGNKFSTLEKNILGQLEGLGKVQGRIDQSQTAFQEQLARYQALTDKGLKPQEAIAEMGKTDAEAEWKNNLQKQLSELAQIVKNGGSAQNSQQEAAKVFETLGLDLKDPRVALAAAKKYDTPEMAELEAYRLQRQIAQSPDPTAAQNAALNGNFTATNTEAQFTRLEELYKNYTQNKTEIDAIESGLRAGGFMK